MNNGPFFVYVHHPSVHLFAFFNFVWLLWERVNGLVCVCVFVVRILISSIIFFISIIFFVVDNRNESAHNKKQKQLKKIIICLFFYSLVLFVEVVYDLVFVRSSFKFNLCLFFRFSFFKSSLVVFTLIFLKMKLTSVYECSKENS